MTTLKEEWHQRQKRFGNTRRAVLFKNFPSFFNDRLHRSQLKFIRRHLPRQPRAILDAGCGYGRLSMPLKEQFPESAFQGIELCDEFARNFESEVGPCFRGSVTDFEPARTYDAVLIVTLLMYLGHEERLRALRKLWSVLEPGGRMLLMEPRQNFLTHARRKGKIESLSPTGGDVKYFERNELRELVLDAAPEATVVGAVSIGFPIIAFPCLHEGLAVEKPGRQARGEAEA